jgi:hypothetical protein
VGVSFLLNTISCKQFWWCVNELMKKEVSSRWNHVYTVCNAMKPHKTSVGGYCFISYENSTKQGATSKWYETHMNHKKWHQTLKRIVSILLYMAWQSWKQQSDSPLGLALFLSLKLFSDVIVCRIVLHFCWGEKMVLSPSGSRIGALGPTRMARMTRGIARQQKQALLPCSREKHDE